MTANVVEDFVVRCIRVSPRNFPDRTAVLHYALCTIGTGLGWDANGNLTTYGENMPEWSREGDMSEFNQFTSKDAPLYDSLLEYQMRNIDTCQERVDNVHNLALQKWDLATPYFNRSPFDRNNIYPQTEQALLMNIPENVSPEWLEACEEMKAIASKHKWKF